jgi:hypothetical protein
MPPQRITALIGQARLKLGWTQRDLGTNLDSSHRTATRWEAGLSTFYPAHAAKLAQHVYPIDRELAAELAAATGQTLVGLGIEAPPPPPAPPVFVAPPRPPAPPPPAPRPTALRDLLEAIVCTVADEANVAPKVVRPSVLLTLQRALDVGLDLNAAQAAGLLTPAREAGTET